MRGILLCLVSFVSALAVAPAVRADDTTPISTGSTMSLVAPSEAGTSTASLPAAVSEAKPRLLKAELYTETDVHTKTAATQNFAGVRYDLSADSFWGVRQLFNSTNPVGSQATAYTMLDTYVDYANFNLTKFAGDGTLIGFFRAYLPTGEDARFMSHEQGSLYSWLIATKSFGKFDFNGHMTQRVYDQVHDGYIGPDGKPVANPVYDINPWAEVAWNITPKVQWVNSVGWEGTINRHYSTAVNTFRDYNLTTYLAYKPVKQLWLAAYLLDDTVNNNGKPFAFGNADDMTVELIAFATL